MTEDSFLPDLPDQFEGTRATLHAYALAVAALPRAFADPHPRSWHIALDVTERGLETKPVPLAAGDHLRLAIDLRDHDVVLTTSRGDRHTVSMSAGLTGTEMADRLIALAAIHGLEGAIQRDKFENDDSRSYDPAVAGTFLHALESIARTFEEHRARIGGDTSPVQVWPHGFDLAVDWFGTRLESHVENGETRKHRAQLNLGFFPGGRPYFYSNPWPFEADRLLHHPLPHGAEWHLEGWEGSILYYDLLQQDPEAEKNLLEYAAAVYDVAAPTLMA